MGDYRDEKVGWIKANKGKLFLGFVVVGLVVAVTQLFG